MTEKEEREIFVMLARIDERIKSVQDSNEKKFEQDRIMFTQHDKRICGLEQENAIIKGKATILGAISAFITGIFMWLLGGIDISKIWK